MRRLFSKAVFLIAICSWCCYMGGIFTSSIWIDASYSGVSVVKTINNSSIERENDQVDHLPISIIIGEEFELAEEEETEEKKAHFKGYEAPGASWSLSGFLLPSNWSITYSGITTYYQLFILFEVFRL